MEDLTLVQQLTSLEKMNMLENIEISENIINNIKHVLRDYQVRTLKRFLFYDKNDAVKKEPIHTLFNLATGAGKTLLMACLILYYYEKGYRHFLFFVNQTNIVSKTEDNLFNSSSPKYLFKENILINGKKIKVRKVDSFDDDKDSIQIQFSTIQGLHNDILVQKENRTTLEDLNKKDIIMISDECHHLNAMTKKTKGAIEEESSWEHTIVNRILHKDQNNKNVLLEFTATIPNEQTVKDKYKNKTIIDFDLKSFVKEKYTKDVNLIYTSFDKKERILTALLLNWYRQEIANKYNIYLKPVILFRSKTIEESRGDYDYFLKLVKNLKETDFDSIKNSFKDIEAKEDDEKNKLSVLLRIDNYIKNNKISFNNIIQSIKLNFEEKYCIITNSKDNKGKKEETSEELDTLLNNLENRNNLIRAIFTVNRLTEGWDVLNLFDIVRLYEGQNTGGGHKGAAGGSTVSEVQLIGRGVRLYPFKFEDNLEYKRKFDNDLTNELRVLEEFHYHSDDEHRYIADLKKELDKEGLLVKEKQKKEFKLKDRFKKTHFFKTYKVAVNKRIPNPNKKKESFENIKTSLTKAFVYSSNNIAEVEVYENKTKTNIEKISKIYDVKLSDYKNIVYKVFARDNSSFYSFLNLKEYLDIDSIDDLFLNKFLGDILIKISYDAELTNNVVLMAFKELFKELENKLRQDYEPYVGSEFYLEDFKNVFDVTKEKFVEESYLEKSNYLNTKMQDCDWYPLDTFYGTGLEGEFVAFVERFCLEPLQEKFDEVYLLRNEEVYTIYEFKEGRGFQPDFLLFLRNQHDASAYQCFMEVKGEHISEKDSWKEEFMEDIENRGNKVYGKSVLKIETERFKLIGFPFYKGKDDRDDFLDKLNSLMHKK